MKTFSRVAVVLIGMTGLAAAQPKADSKPAPPPAPGAGSAAGQSAGSAAGQSGGMPEMKPAQELADMAKMTAGTWKCKGQGMDHTNKMVDTTGTMKIKLDVSNWWLHTSFESKMGKEPFQFESFATYDATAKKWKRTMIESGGGWSAGDADAAPGGKLDWNLTFHVPSAVAAMMGGKAELAFRDHQDLSDAKAGMKVSGEYTMDGKTWMKVYDMACKK